MKIIIYVMLCLVSLGCKQNPVEEKKPNRTDAIEQRQPIMLDDIHYYTLDREACNSFFETNFGTRAMLEDSPNPFEFIDFQLVKSGQSTINISKQGPFPGIKVGDPKRWERTLISPAADNPPRYGVHWVALSTADLDAQLKKLKANGVEIINDKLELPHTDKRAALCFGPDFNLIVITESERLTEGTYSIDHLMLLVKDLEANIKFYRDVFGGKMKITGDGYVEMDIGKHNFILAQPNVLGIDSSIVEERDPTVFRPDIDHLGFLYADVQPAYEYAISKGHTFLTKPVPISYFGRATLYTFAITYSPDGLQCELFQEAGRLGSRKKIKH